MYIHKYINKSFQLLPSDKHLCSIMPKTESRRRSFFPQAIQTISTLITLLNLTHILQLFYTLHLFAAQRLHVAISFLNTATILHIASFCCYLQCSCLLFYTLHLLIHYIVSCYSQCKLFWNNVPLLDKSSGNSSASLFGERRVAFIIQKLHPQSEVWRREAKGTVALHDIKGNMNAGRYWDILKIHFISSARKLNLCRNGRF